jgi:hypothetical protein
MEALKTTFQEFKVDWQEMYLMENIMDEYNQEDMLGMILRLIVMIGIWIVVISGMTTTSIFYLMTLLHLHVEPILESTQEPSLTYSVLQFFIL